jgi:hypothetical protein
MTNGPVLLLNYYLPSVTSVKGEKWTKGLFCSFSKAQFLQVINAFWTVACTHCNIELRTFSHRSSLRKKSCNVFDKTETREVAHRKTTDCCERNGQLVHHSTTHVNIRGDMFNDGQDQPLNATISAVPQYFILEDDKNVSESTGFDGRMA